MLPSIECLKEVAEAAQEMGGETDHSAEVIESADERVEVWVGDLFGLQDCPDTS